MEETSAMTIPVLRFLPVFLSALTMAHAGLARPADGVGVKVTKSGPGVYSFAATVRHGDTGWKHYAGAWKVLGPDGKVRGTRELAHPHEHE